MFSLLGRPRPPPAGEGWGGGRRPRRCPIGPHPDPPPRGEGATRVHFSSFQSPFTTFITTPASGRMPQWSVGE